MPRINVYLTAHSLPLDLPGTWQPVVFDVLRATTTIVTALAAGATAVVPVATPEEALQARTADPDGVVAAGERHARPVPGFDLGNGPDEFVPARVAGRRIVMSTTNGTRALLRAAAYGDVVCGALLNRTAVVRYLEAGRADVLLVCAGTQEAFSAEDLAAAGSVVEGLRAGNAEWQPDDLAQVAQAWFGAHRADLAAMVAATEHGRFLQAQGYAADLRRCAALDVSDLLPLFRAGRIVAI